MISHAKEGASLSSSLDASIWMSVSDVATTMPPAAKACTTTKTSITFELIVTIEIVYNLMGNSHTYDM